MDTGPDDPGERPHHPAVECRSGHCSAVPGDGYLRDCRRLLRRHLQRRCGLSRASARRPGIRHHRWLRGVRRGVRFVDCNGGDFHQGRPAGNAQARLRAFVRYRHDCRWRHPQVTDPAVDRDDSLLHRRADLHLRSFRGRPDTRAAGDRLQHAGRRGGGAPQPRAGSPGCRGRLAREGGGIEASRAGDGADGNGIHRPLQRRFHRQRGRVGGGRAVADFRLRAWPAQPCGAVEWLEGHRVFHRDDLHDPDRRFGIHLLHHRRPACPMH